MSQDNSDRLKDTIKSLMLDDVKFNLSEVSNYLINNRIIIKGKERLVLIALLAIDDAKSDIEPTSNNEAYLVMYNLAKEILYEELLNDSNI